MPPPFLIIIWEQGQARAGTIDRRRRRRGGARSTEIIALAAGIIGLLRKSGKSCARRSHLSNVTF